MRTYDFSPLFRSAIGFDRLASLLDEAARAESGGFPPYNIERVDENRYRITMAVAGFKEDELHVELERDTLTISGKQVREEKEERERKYLHRGIASREFTQRFELAEHLKVTGAQLENGLLHVDLVREVPEAMKPRKIEIRRADGTHLIEGESEAA